MRLLSVAITAFVIHNAACVSQANAYATLDVSIDRMIDADTFDFSGELIPGLLLSGRIRLMCINAPEKRTQAGKELIEHLATLGIVAGRIEILDRDVFGRYLAHFTPEGWSMTLNKYLFERGSPYYARLTKAERAKCEELFE